MTLEKVLFPIHEFPLTSFLASLGRVKDFYGPGVMQQMTGGFDALTTALVNELETLPNVDMRLNHSVVSVEELGAQDFFVRVKLSGGQYVISFQCEKVFFACAAEGMKKIKISGNRSRQLRIEEMLGKTYSLPAIKVFLTYKSPWWEKYGFHHGEMKSNMLIKQTIAFGKAAVTDGHATLLASFTYGDLEVFEDLDGPQNPRYDNFQQFGYHIPEVLVPSRLLVEHVERQICQLFGRNAVTVLQQYPMCCHFSDWLIYGNLII